MTFHDGRVVSFVWFVSQTVEASDNVSRAAHLGISVDLPDGTVFVYNAWTDPDQRGRRLAGLALAFAVRHRVLGALVAGNLGRLGQPQLDPGHSIHRDGVARDGGAVGGRALPNQPDSEAGPSVWACGWPVTRQAAESSAKRIPANHGLRSPE